MAATAGFDLGELLGPPIIYGSVPGENIYAGDDVPGAPKSPKSSTDEEVHVGVATSSARAASCATPAGAVTRASPPPTGPVRAGARKPCGSRSGVASSSFKWNPVLFEQVMVLGQRKGEPFRKQDIATVVQANEDGTFDLVYVIGPQRLKGMRKNQDFERYTPRRGKTRSQARASRTKR